MTAYYLELRTLHIACAYVSIALFIVRHVLNLRRIDWRKSRALRIMPHAIDSVLLISAVLLTIITHQYPFVSGWLTVKLIALVAYIGLGMVALKHGPTQGVRRTAFLAAVIVFAFMLTVARTRSPLGIFSEF